MLTDLVTGANSFDNVPWLNKLVEYSKRIYAEQSRLRLIAVCFGHQVFARALGSMPFRNPKGWELSVCNIDLTPEAAKFFGKSKLVWPSLATYVANNGGNALRFMTNRQFTRCTKMSQVRARRRSSSGARR